MKNIIKLCVVVAIAACTPTREAATVKAGFDAAKCVLNHPPAPPAQIVIDCGKGELTNGDVVDILFAAKHAPANAGAPAPSSSAAPCK